MSIVLSGTTNDITVNGVSVATDAEVNSALAGKANTADLKEIGVGQTWQDVTASRVIGATYTNTTGKPIMVIIGMDTYASYQTIEVGGLDISGNGNMGGGNPIFIVPNGSTYKFVSTNTGTLRSWCELR